MQVLKPPPLYAIIYESLFFKKSILFLGYGAEIAPFAL